MACELARHGAPVRIIDKSPGIDPHCRANFIHSRTLEVFQDLGVVHEIQAEGSKLLGGNLYANGRRFLHSRYPGVDSPFPWGIALPQWRTEEILEGLLNRLGVQVERQTELVGITSYSHGVRATLIHGDGRREDVNTPWVIGCDGAHSTVRHLNQVQFPGEADPHPYVLADVVVDAPINHDEWHGFLTDKGVLYFFLLSERRFLIIASLPQDHRPATAIPTLGEVQALVAERGPAGARISDPRWLMYFHIHYRLARHYRHARIFLAGDAVHIHSPVGGHGMNTGIQDAYNLAWKLALVTRGRASELLLDSYEAERRSVAEDLLKSTKTVTEGNEEFEHLSADERERFCSKMVVPEPEQIRIARHEEELDLDYRKSPICAEYGSGFSAGPHAGAQAPDLERLQIDGQTITLFELLRGPHHTLLLFMRDTDHQSSKNDLVDQALSVVHSYGDLIKVCLVSTNKNSEPVSQRQQVTVVQDPEQNLRRRYGAETECLYLIRPDGYVAYRSRPPSMSTFQEYLKRIF